MAIKHLRDGEDFGPSHFSKDFGFHGSADGTGRPHVKARGGRAASPPFAADEPMRGQKHEAEPEEEGGGAYAHGGRAHNMHPHGHEIVRVEHRHDGSVVHHHAHGGFTVHHAHGGVTHHGHDGTPAHAGAPDAQSSFARGSAVHAHPNGHNVTHVEPTHEGEIHHHAHGGYTMHHDDGRVTHHHRDGGLAQHGMAHGGHEMAAMRSDIAQDKRMVEKAVRQHENHEHEGEHTDLHLARGGLTEPRTRLPRGMKPMAARHRSPIETPPRNPNLTTTPRNVMPGGQMGYGTEPSAEPDMAGEDQGISQMHKGGRSRKAR